MPTYEEFKNDVLTNQPRKVKAPMVNIKFEDLDTIIFEGEEFKLSPQGFDSLIKMLELSGKGLKTFKETLGKSKTRKLIQLLAEAMKNKGLLNTVVKEKSDKDGFGIETETLLVSNVAVLTVSPQTGMVERVTQSSKSNSTPLNRFFSLCETGITSHGLEILDMASNEAGEVIINAYSPDQTVSINKETYHYGMQFDSNVSLSTFRPLYYNPRTKERIAFSSAFDTVHLRSDAFAVTKNLAEILQRRLIPDSGVMAFVDKMRQADKVQASIAEQRRFYRKIIKACPISLNNQMSGLFNKFVKYDTVRQDYATKGWNIDKCKEKLITKVRCNQTVASLARGTAILAACMPGSKVNYDVVKMTREAGAFLAKENWDINDTLPTLSKIREDAKRNLAKHTARGEQLQGIKKRAEETRKEMS